MPVPIVYRRGTEQLPISVDFTEFATGNGIVRFDCMAGETNVATVTTYTYYALPQGTGIFTKGNYGFSTVGTAFNNSDGMAKRQDLNFDCTSQNYATIIKGRAMVQITFALASTGVTTTSGYLVLNIMRVRDGVETVIGTATTVTRNASSANILPYTETVIIDVTETSFVPEDTLRLNVEVWASQTSGSNVGNTLVLHDPANRVEANIASHSVTTNPSYQAWFIPFKIDL